MADGVNDVFQDDKVHNYSVFYEHKIVDPEDLKSTVSLRP